MFHTFMLNTSICKYFVESLKIITAHFKFDIQVKHVCFNFTELLFFKFQKLQLEDFSMFHL